MMMMMMMMLSILGSISVVSCFSTSMKVMNHRSTRTTSSLFADIQDIEFVLQTEYPTFYSILLRNTDLWKEWRSPDVDTYTIFCPSELALRTKLGETKLRQLQDDRNYETICKFTEYHVIFKDAVTRDDLWNAGGLVTMGGHIVPIERSRGGGGGGWLSGIFGGNDEDGGILIGGNAKLISTRMFGTNGILHETDGVVSPNLLWRYMDQLRIPGSK
jgi:Fasciclin domain